MTNESENLTPAQKLSVVQEIRILAHTRHITDRQALDAYETELSDELMGKREKKGEVRA